MIGLTIEVNGEPVGAEIEERTLLLDFLRDVAKLNGARNGCYEARCGCCSVLLDGQVVKSCNVLALQAEGKAVTTVEALAPVGDRPIEDPTAEAGLGTYEPLRVRGVAPERLSPLQAAFHAHGAMQCGYCTPGMLIVLTEYLQRTRAPTEAGVREALRGNICRCTGYQSIVDAALDAAEAVYAGGEKSHSRESG